MNKFITKKDVFKIIAKSLDVSQKKIDENSNSNHFEDWDSMGHLNILIALDKRLSGKARKIQELSEAFSIKKIIQILAKNKLLK